MRRHRAELLNPCVPATPPSGVQCVNEGRLLSRQARSNHSQGIVRLLAEGVDLYLATFTVRLNLKRERVPFAGEIVDERYGPYQDYKNNQNHEAISPPALRSHACTRDRDLQFKPFRGHGSLRLLIHRIRMLAHEPRPGPHLNHSRRSRMFREI